jgi:hypothetical protein
MQRKKQKRLKQKRIATSEDGIYYVERNCKADKSRTERAWIGRWTDETVTPRKQREAVLGREITEGMDIRAAKVKLDQFKAGLAKLLTKSGSRAPEPGLTASARICLKTP